MKDFPDFLESCKSLSTLSLVGVGLGSIPTWIKDLQSLRVLDLSQNFISQIPDELCEMSWLTNLKFDNCRIKQLPRGLERLESLRELGIENNPSLRLPDEIAGSRKPKTILSYYRRITPEGIVRYRRTRPTPLNEFKLVLVGRGGVGKTSLVHKLVTGEFETFKRTDGISISDLNVRCGSDQVRAHIWDFGGQEIMHGTHRFFITSRSLYLIILSAREGVEDVDADYWLSLVRSLAGDVPIIVVLNKFHELSFEINRQLLRDKFGRDIKFVECDSMEDMGIDKLHALISSEANRMPELRKAFPAEWVQIKNALPKQEKDWMSFEGFISFCKAHGEQSESASEELAGYLHDLGIMLSYRHDSTLRNFGVLNPHWVTNGIYSIITAQKFKNKGGRISTNDFSSILSPKDYPPNVYPFLLALMRKFDLCFPLDDNGLNYLIPELLTKEEPVFEHPIDRDTALGFSYHYETALPHGLLPRFIVQTYVHILPGFVWRSGVMLMWRHARALVRGDVPGRTIHIWIQGPQFHRVGLMKIIRTHFERIHESYENLPVIEKVPIPGLPTYEVSYSLIVKHLEEGIKNVVVDIGRSLASVSVKEILENVGMPKNVVMRNTSQISATMELYDSTEPLFTFISYSHRDARMNDELHGALTIYERNGELELWSDTNIVPGQKWEKEILAKLEKADIIILLLSNDFIQSDYCVQKEMKIAIKREARGECAIVPIVVRACRSDKMPIGKIQAICPNGKPIKNSRDRDVAWKQVTEQIDRVIKDLRENRTNRVAE